MSKKRRLLFVSHEMTLSGAPIQLAYLVVWLQERGWQTTVVAPEPGPLAAKLAGIEIIYESQLLIDPAYGALRRLAPQFDAVIANTIATWEAVQAANLEKVPVVWYLHETQVGVYLMNKIHMIEPSLELADAIVTPTEATARIYSELTSMRIEVVPYGIPHMAAVPAGPAEVVKFVVIGTYERRKGQDVFLEALRQLPSTARARASFKCAGRKLDGPFFEALRACSEAVQNFELLGSLDHEAALHLLSQSDVFVCPSRDETMPIVLLEAMSLGKAIICTAVGGIEEWIRDGDNGLLVPPENAGALAAAIEKLVVDRGLIARLGRAGRETFERYFTIDHYGAEFARIIDRTIEGAATASDSK